MAKLGEKFHFQKYVFRHVVNDDLEVYTPFPHLSSRKTSYSPRKARLQLRKYGFGLARRIQYHWRTGMRRSSGVTRCTAGGRCLVRARPSLFGVSLGSFLLRVIINGQSSTRGDPFGCSMT